MNSANDIKAKPENKQNRIEPSEKKFDFLLKILIILVIVLPPLAVWKEQIKMFAYAKFLLIRILVVITFAVFIIKKLRLGQLNFRKNPLNLPILLFNLVFFLTLFKGRSLYLGIWDYSNILFYSLTFYIIVNTVKSYEELSWLVNIIISVGFIAAFYGFCQSLGFDPIFPDIRTSGRFKIFSFYGNPNFFAGFLIIIVPLIAYKILESDLWGKILYSIVLCPFAWVLLATRTRSSWVALSVAAFFIIVNIIVLAYKFGDRYKNLAFKVIVTSVFLIMTGISFFIGVRFVNSYFLENNEKKTCKIYQESKEKTSEKKKQDYANWQKAKKANESFKKQDLFKQYMSRFASIFDIRHKHSRQRFLLWHVSLLMAQKNPILGVGIGNWKQNFFKYQKMFFKKKGSEIYYDVAASPLRAHNEYIQFLSEGGLLGLSAFLLMIFVLFYFELKIVYSTQNFNRQVFIIFVLSSLVAVLTQCMFSFPFHRPAVSLYFFIFMGLLMVENILFRKEQQPHKTRYFQSQSRYGIFEMSIQLIIIGMALFSVRYAYRIFKGNSYVKEGMHIAASNPPYSTMSADAERYYKKSLEYDPNYGETHFRLAQNYQARADYFGNPQIQNDMLKNNKFTREQIDRIVLEHNKKCLNEYIISLRTVDSRFTYFYAGLVYQKLAELTKDNKYLKDAYKRYDYISSVMPNYTKAQYNMGVICYRIVEKMGKSLTEEERKMYLERASRAWKAAISYSAEKTVEAQRRMPEFERAYFNLAIYHYNKREYATAKNYFKKTLEINPRNPEVKKYQVNIKKIINDFITLGKQSISNKKFSDGKKYFQKALELDPGNPDVKKCINEFFPVSNKN